MSGFLAVMRKEFQHVLRDPWSLAGTTLGTVVLMILMAYAISADIEYIPIAVYDGDLSPQSRAYLQCFVNDTFFDVRYWAQSDTEAREWVRSDRVKGAIIVPAGFAEAVQQGKQAPVQIIADGTEPNIALQITGNAEALSAGFSVELLEQRLNKAGIVTPADVSHAGFDVLSALIPANVAESLYRKCLKKAPDTGAKVEAIAGNGKTPVQVKRNGSRFDLLIKGQTVSLQQRLFRIGILSHHWHIPAL